MNTQLLARLNILEAKRQPVESMFSGVDAFGTLIVEMLKIKQGGSIDDTPADLRDRVTHLITICDSMNANIE